MNIGFTGTRKGMTESQRNRFFELVATIQPERFHHGSCRGADADAHQELDSFIPGKTEIVAEIHPPTDTRQAMSLRRTSERRPEDFECLDKFLWLSDDDIIHPPKPYLERNRDIVDATAGLIVCPAGPEELRSGTWSTCRYARRLGRPIWIVWPDGRVTTENQP